MKFTSNIFHIVNNELYYQWHSKRIFIVFIILLFLCAAHLLGLHNDVFSSYRRYKTTEETYMENGIDIIEALEADNNSYVDGNARIVDNPLKEDFIALSVSIQNLKPQNIIGNTLEYLVFVFCTLLFGIYAAYVATYDFKFKTYKFGSVRNRQIDILLGKIMSVIIVMFITLTISLLLVFAGSFIVNAIVSRQIPIENYAIDIFNYEYGVPLQGLLSFLVICFYIVAGFCIGFLAKSMVIPAIALLLYGLFVPVLGTYDFRNIFSYFSHKIFTFTARFVMFTPKPINETIGIAITVAATIIMLALIFGVSQKRSSYN